MLLCKTTAHFLPDDEDDEEPDSKRLKLDHDDHEDLSKDEERSSHEDDNHDDYATGRGGTPDYYPISEDEYDPSTSGNQPNATLRDSGLLCYLLTLTLI